MRQCECGRLAAGWVRAFTGLANRQSRAGTIGLDPAGRSPVRVGRLAAWSPVLLMIAHQEPERRPPFRGPRPAGFVAALCAVVLFAAGGSRRSGTSACGSSRWGRCGLPSSRLTRKSPRPTPRTTQLPAAVRPGRPAAEGRGGDAPAAAAGDRDRSGSGQDLLVRRGGLSRRAAAGAARASRRTPSTPTARAVAHAYWFLLDPKLDRFRNPYDPEFRRACDLYNDSLAGGDAAGHQAGPRCGRARRRSFRPGKKQFQVQVVLARAVACRGHRAAGVRQRLRDR